MNVTNSLGTTMAVSSFGSWFSMIVIVGIVAVALSVAVMALSSITQYKRLKGALKFLSDSFNYFMMGIATLAALAVPGLVIYYFFKQASKGNVAPLWITGCLIGGYIMIALIGFISKHTVLNRIKFFEEEIKTEEKKE